jgi:hypothetical protein
MRTPHLPPAAVHVTGAETTGTAHRSAGATKQQLENAESVLNPCLTI